MEAPALEQQVGWTADAGSAQTHALLAEASPRPHGFGAPSPPRGFHASVCEDADTDALFELFGQNDFRRFAMMDHEPFASPEAIRDWLRAGRGTAFNMAARIGETIVGFAGLYPLPGRQNHVAWITMTVHEDHRGRGIGTAMLRLILATADLLMGLRRVQLHVLADNRAALSLYRSCGFAIEGRHEGMVRTGDDYVDAYTMARRF